MDVQTVERLVDEGRVEGPDGVCRPLTPQQTNMLREFITEDGVTTYEALGRAACSAGNDLHGLIKVQVSKLRGAVKRSGFEIVSLGKRSGKYQLRERI